MDSSSVCCGSKIQPTQYTVSCVEGSCNAMDLRKPGPTRPDSMSQREPSQQKERTRQPVWFYSTVFQFQSMIVTNIPSNRLRSQSPAPTSKYRYARSARNEKPNHLPPRPLANRTPHPAPCSPPSQRKCALQMRSL